MNLKILSIIAASLFISSCAENTPRNGSVIKPQAAAGEEKEQKREINGNGFSENGETDDGYVCKNPEPAACAVEKALAGIGTEFSQPKESSSEEE